MLFCKNNYFPLIIHVQLYMIKILTSDSVTTWTSKVKYLNNYELVDILLTFH